MYIKKCNSLGALFINSKCMQEISADFFLTKQRWRHFSPAKFCTATADKQTVPAFFLFFFRIIFAKLLTFYY